MIQALRHVLRTVRRYPTIGISLLIILLLLGMSAHVVIRVPLSEAVTLWNDSPPETWSDNPRLAQPAWTNRFRRVDLPETTVVSMEEAERITESLSETMQRETILLTFDYTYIPFPSEITLFYTMDYNEKVPLVTLTWIKPDGTEIPLHRASAARHDSRFWISQALSMGEALAQDPQDEEALQGQYAIRVEIVTFEPDLAPTEARLVVYGRVYGLAGTDDQRRDLALALQWGTPVALVFGLLATLGSTLLGFTLAAVGAWLGGWVDGIVQRVTEVGMMIPFLPTIMMIAMYYSRNLWVLLGFVVLLNIFTAAVKSYRAMFLQVKNAPYIEAARAYGAGNSRIIFRYMIPQIAPVLLPQFILAVPRFVYLEASLGLLGIADPNLLTWGKVLSAGRDGLYAGHYYWVLEPACLLILTGIAFSLLGYALDRVFNPRLRDT